MNFNLLCCWGEVNDDEEVIDEVIDEVIECGLTADEAGDDVEDAAPEQEFRKFRKKRNKFVQTVLSLLNTFISTTPKNDFICSLLFRARYSMILILSFLILNFSKFFL